jgi:hypothetical protein
LGGVLSYNSNSLNNNNGGIAASRTNPSNLDLLWPKLEPFYSVVLSWRVASRYGKIVFLDDDEARKTKTVEVKTILALFMFFQLVTFILLLSSFILSPMIQFFFKSHNTGPMFFLFTGVAEGVHSHAAARPQRHFLLFAHPCVD